MADLTPLNFDPKNQEEVNLFKAVPPGIYTVVIVDSDVMDTKTEGGKMLVLTYQIVEGPSVGESLTDRLNIMNRSDTAQKIGLSQLKNICDAIGKTGQLKDSSELHGKPFSVKVIVEPFKNRDGKELMSNRIEKRMPKRAPAVDAMPTVSNAATAATAEKPAARPWG